MANDTLTITDNRTGKTYEVPSARDHQARWTSGRSR
jgi:hypothetical protein